MCAWEDGERRKENVVGDNEWACLKSKTLEEKDIPTVFVFGFPCYWCCARGVGWQDCGGGGDFPPENNNKEKEMK